MMRQGFVLRSYGEEPYFQENGLTTVLEFGSKTLLLTVKSFREPTGGDHECKIYCLSKNLRSCSPCIQLNSYYLQLDIGT